MDEVKNMLDYKVGKYEDIPPTYKKNILRPFMFIKQKFFPNGDMYKLKARLVADGSQQGRHLYDFVSSATISLQVAYLLYNIASYYRCILSDIHAFFNAEHTPADSPIDLKINKDVVPYWVKQDPNAVPYVSSTGEFSFFLYRLKQSPLKFQLHLSRTIIDASYRQSTYDEYPFYNMDNVRI